jgi:hypothetical protein
MGFKRRSIYNIINRIEENNIPLKRSNSSGSQMSPNTVAKWYETCREACMNWVESRVSEGKIGGDTSVVEVDETPIGRRKHNRGRLF